MVTERVPGLDVALPAGSYVTVAQRSVDAWVGAVISGLGSADAQARADEAHQHVLAAHTYDDRARVVLERMATLPRRTISDLDRRRALAAAWSRWQQPAALRALDLPLPTAVAYQAASVAWGAATRAAPLGRSALALLQRRKNSR